MTPQIKTYIVMIDFRAKDGTTTSRPICGLPTREAALAQGDILLATMKGLPEDWSQPVAAWVDSITVYLEEEAAP